MGYYGLKFTIHDDELDRFMRAAKRIEARGSADSRDADELVALAPYLASCVERAIPAKDRGWEFGTEDDQW